MLFYRQLSQLLASGVSAIEAFGILESQPGPARLRNVIVRIKQSLVAGSSLADAFAYFPDFFPALHVNIIRYSEKAGRLAQGVGSLAQYLEKDYAAQQRIAVGLAYPALLLHAAMFLLPIVNAVGCSGCGIAGYLKGFLAMAIPVYGVLFLIWWAVRQRERSPQFRRGLDDFLLVIPRVGDLVRSFSLTRFIRAMQSLCSSGVSIVSAWRLSCDACGNEVIKERLLRGLELIGQGQLLSRAFMQAETFPPHIIGMIATAEKSGSIVQTLDTLAAMCERENETAITVLTVAVPVIFYILIAGFIAFRVVSFYAGYYNRIFSFQ
ncbi:MAG: type II secretion system F family protein [Candidatus Omnitrophica bacterium]|nr:type II secretion system F family protein [Candidatus Omnitrophota bacterium]